LGQKKVKTKINHQKPKSSSKLNHKLSMQNNLRKIFDTALTYPLITKHVNQNITISQLTYIPHV